MENEPANVKTQEELEELLEAAKQSQTDYWEDLGELEAALGIEIDGSTDLSSMTLDDLRAADKENGE